MLVVSEIFHSIQGESTYAGWPCAFIRLAGCNLRCSYCDTRYAYAGGDPMPIEAILERVRAFGCSLVEVTGGEPLLQAETPALVERLLDDGFDVLLETNGSLDISAIDPRCVRIVDVKCPSSGAAEANDLENLGRLRERDEVKFVIGTEADYRFAREMVRQIHRAVCIHFAPVFGRLAPRELAQWILSDRLPVRLNLQLHKTIWDPEQRGV